MTENTAVEKSCDGCDNQCIRCGRCCWQCYARLEVPEALSGKYKCTSYSGPAPLGDGMMYLAKKLAFIKELNQIIKVCWYFDEQFGCLIYDDRPEVCRNFTCLGTRRKEDVKVAIEWNISWQEAMVRG